MTWKKGQSGNSKGRPKGTKHVLSDEYLRAMSADFEKYGAKVIEKVRATHPEVYLKLISTLVPKDYRMQQDVVHYVINAQPVLTVDQWRELHNVKENKVLEHLQ